MKCQDLCSPKNKIKSKLSSAAVVICTLRVYSFSLACRDQNKISVQIVDPDKMALNESSYQDLHCMPCSY